MKIFYNDTSLDIQVNDNSYRYRAIKGEHSLTLYFSLPQHVELPVGAYCEFEAETYTLETPENFKMHNSRNFEYTVVFESSQAKAKKYKFRNPVDKRLKFNLTATPREHLQMLVDNLNMRDGGWTIGQCIDAPEKLISYNHAFCLDALSQQATDFETEYEFNGKQVSLWKVEYHKDNPLPLSYGRGKGFKPGVGRTNFNDSKPVEVLFVHGGEQNIDASKYKSRELLLPKNQTLRYDGKFFEGQAGFDASIAHAYISDAEGLSIQRQDKSLRSHEEDSLDLSHIYPSRVGEVTKVEVTKEGFCDFFDTTIPDALDFSTPESRFKGETMTVIFQSGMLAGKEFEIQQNDTRVIGYIHSERRFKVVEQIVDGEPMPKGSFMPVVGDKYAIFGIALPDAYICDDTTKTGASWDMFREAAKYLYENEEQKFTFTGELDGIWAKKDWINIGGRIKLGGYVLFRDDQFQSEGVGIRIVGVKDYINNPHSPEIELSNSVIGSSIMSDLRKAESNEVVTDAQHKAALQFTKRQFRDAKETIALLEAALRNFSASIQPVTVQTMQLLAGDESLQFQFVQSVGIGADKAFSILFDKDTKQLHITGGLSSGFCRLQHKTLGVDNISSSHKESEYRSWILEPFASACLGDEFADQSYYLYARCRKNGKTSLTDYDRFILRETPQSFDGDENYYYLLVGILNSEYDGSRSFVSLFGYTEILPGRITADLIASSDGNTYFDLLRGIIGGTIRFTSGSSGLENLSEWQSKQSEIDHAGQAAADAQSSANEAARKAQEAKDYLDNTLPAELSELNRRMDGVVENWFLPYTPSSDNAPASAWTTASERLNHVGDTFTNTQSFLDESTTPDAGKSWRWVDAGGYRWTPIADSDAVKALQQAARAQDTADAKRRNFVVQPSAPYDVGDMWMQGASGEVMRCIRSRQSGAYDASDWDKAAKYTDDSAVNNLQVGGRNYVTNIANWALDAVDALSHFREHTDGSGRMELYNNTGYSAAYCPDFPRSGLNALSFDIEVVYAMTLIVETRIGIIGSNVEEYRDNIYFHLPAGFKRRIELKLSGESPHNIYFSTQTNHVICYIGKVKFEKGSKATDWTESPEDAESRLNQVRATANQSKQRLADWASDDIISPVEKTGLRQQRAAIAAECAQLKAEAERYGVSIAAYDAACNAAFAALTKYTAATPESISVEADYAHIAAYYIAAEGIRNAVGNVTDVNLLRNDIAKDLGYADYAEMERVAKAGRTIIEGGKIRTELLEASQIVAMGVDVVNGSSRVKITPDDGMTLLENNKITAKFTGQQIGSVLDNIPVNSNVLITEQKSRFSDIPENDSTTLTLASGVISGTSFTPVTIEIPPIRIYALMKLIRSDGMPMTTMYVSYLVNGVAQSSFEFTIEDFETYEEYVGQDQGGYPIYETRYRGEMGRQITTPAFFITANSPNKPVLVQVRYSFHAQPDLRDVWDNKLYAQFPGSALEAAPASKYLDVGGRSFNSTFYGNGLIFSKSINQIVGMSATDEGTELIARSGNHGLKVDNTGVSHLKSDGSGWDNSGLLCGYHVNVDGTFATQFGIKDKPNNRCGFQRNPGIYRLTHNIGHTDYVVSVVVASSGFEFTNIGAKSANYVDIEIHDGNFEFANRSFMILIFGRP